MNVMRRSFISLRNFWIPYRIVVLIVAFIFLMILFRRNSLPSEFDEGTMEVWRKWFDLAGDPKWYNQENVSMFDTRLLEEMRSNWITRGNPSVPLHLENPELHDPSMGQAAVIMEIFKNKTNGVFIECGAYDGETRSNTLVLERFLGWTGILIEANPINFKKMLDKSRNAYQSPTCLSIKNHPTTSFFLIADNIGRLHEPGDSTEENTMDVAHTGTHIRAQCFPLASYIAALGIDTVDYFSLDVEGAEMSVLKTIPFEKVDIKTLSVEYTHEPESSNGLIEFMKGKGYHVYGYVNHEDNLANDVIFVKGGF